jgi:L-proline---[L-prolyl-carrier protein] ligase
MGQGRRLDDLLLASSRSHADNVAVIEPNAGTITYGELEQQAARIAGFLTHQGIGRGDRVGIHTPKSIGAVASLFGVLKAGATYVPVDPTAPARRNLEILTDCSVKAVITDEPHAERLRAESESAPTMRRLGALEHLSRFTPGLVVIDGISGDENEGPAPEDLAYILYTSGSTGKPKGVMHTHASALSFVDWCVHEFRPTPLDRFSSHAPFHFDLSILDLYVPIGAGAAIVLIGEDLGKQPLKLAELFSGHRLTVWYSTPSILRLLLEYGKIDVQDCSSLRLVLFAGEVFPIKHLRALKDLWRHPRYYNLYGPTETNVCTYYEVPSVLSPDRTDALPIGNACSGDDLQIVSPEGEEVAPGEEGELLVSGGSVMTGYWNRPELTERVFSVDPRDRRWYRTGDVVAEEVDGLRFAGRRDRMVKRRGYRVELGEIESALYRHPLVTEAAMVATPDSESGVLLKAFLSWSGDKPPSLVDLKRFCASNLPLYMVPDRFKVLPELPKTSTDKIDYQKLAGLD